MENVFVYGETCNILVRRADNSSSEAEKIPPTTSLKEGKLDFDSSNEEGSFSPLSD